MLDAVRAALLDGTSFIRPTELELLAAEDFLALVPGTDMGKFCKNASGATSTAIRLARGASGRELVAMCHDQPYFSTQDWFVGTLPIINVACVILDAAAALEKPAPGFLPGVHDRCDRYGAILIFDGTITGFRWAAGGANAVYDVVPDLSTLGKAMGNGFPSLR